MPAYPHLEVNGVNLTHPSGLWALAPEQSFRTLPGRRAASVTVPGRGGVVVPQRMARDTTTFSVSMVVMGDGATNAARVASLETLLGVLDFVFSNSGQMFPVVYVKGPNSRDRLVAQCRRVASTDPERVGNGTTARVSFVLEIPSGEWRSETYTVDNPAVSGPGSVININGLAGSVREVDDIQLMFRGPFGSVRFTNPITGQFVHVDRPGNGNEYMRIDLKNFQAKMVGGPDFLTDTGDDITPKVYNGGPGANYTWLTLTPQLNPSTLSLTVPLQVNGLGNLAIRSRGSF